MNCFVSNAKKNLSCSLIYRLSIFSLILDKFYGKLNSKNLGIGEFKVYQLLQKERYQSGAKTQ